MKILTAIFLLLGCTSRPRTWGIQYQNFKSPYDLGRIASSDVNFWVLEEAEVSARALRTLKSSGKKILAYLSLGEAEDYRSYFKRLPKEVLLEENPDWKGNFTVKYWDPRFQEKIFAVAQELQERGFDGLFLDVVDAFDRFENREDKAREMASFIIELSRKMKKNNKDFLIVPQNGIHIRRHLSQTSDYLTAIDGINVENAIFEDGVSEDIRFYQRHGKFVLSLEYPATKEERAKYFKLAKKLKVIPVAAEKELDGPLYFPEEK